MIPATVPAVPEPAGAIPVVLLGFEAASADRLVRRLAAAGARAVAIAWPAEVEGRAPELVVLGPAWRGTAARKAAGEVLALTGARPLVVVLAGGDDPAPFDDLARRHPVVRRLHHLHPGVRIPRTLAVYEALLPAVLSQKVTGL
ncbi:MAG TPA: hypothetical protein VHQ65_12375, partial [Thermoanaerobaculia bacterium]|nr:hypothetical protein [Thermoanaerobaculia bacterium]